MSKLRDAERLAAIRLHRIGELEPKLADAQIRIAELEKALLSKGIPTRIGVSTCPSDDGKTIAVVGMAVQEGMSFVFYTGNHSITQDASGFVDINFQRLMEK